MKNAPAKKAAAKKADSSRDAAAALWKQAGITDPLNEIDVAEIYVPFSWYEPM